MSRVAAVARLFTARVVAAESHTGARSLPKLTRPLLGLSWVQARSASGCRGCGTCCEHFGGHLRASKSDLKRWKTEGRQDLLNRVSQLGWIWVDPASGTSLVRCPFLDRTGPESALCRIHHTKPEMCRSYPTLAHRHQCVRGVIVQ